jgi:hypothetical protein
MISGNPHHPNLYATDEMSFGHKDTIIIGKAIGPWQTHHHGDQHRH